MFGDYSYRKYNYFETKYDSDGVDYLRQLYWRHLQHSKRVEMKRGCVIILIENTVVSHDNNDGNDVYIINIIILEYF